MTIKSAVDGESLRASDINAYYANNGLKYVARTSISPAAAGLVLYSCFTSEFDAYRVVLSDINSTTAGAAFNLMIQFATAGTTPYTGATYQYIINGVSYAGGALAGNGNNVGYIYLGDTQGLTGARKNGGVLDIISKSGSKPTVSGFMSDNSGAAITNGKVWFVNGFVNNAATYTGFRIYNAGGSTVGGTLTVYGYRKQ